MFQLQDPSAGHFTSKSQEPISQSNEEKVKTQAELKSFPSFVNPIKFKKQKVVNKEVFFVLLYFRNLHVISFCWYVVFFPESPPPNLPAETPNPNATPPPKKRSARQIVSMVQKALEELPAEEELRKTAAYEGNQVTHPTC